MTTKTVEVRRVWLDIISEMAGPWPVQIEAQLPETAEIIWVGLAWRINETGPDGWYPCIRYTHALEEAPVGYRTLYAIQDGGQRQVPAGVEHLGVIQWPTTPEAVHLFGVRGPIVPEEVPAPAE